MKTAIVLAAMVCRAALAQEFTALPPEPNKIIGEYNEAKPNGVRAAASERMAFTGTTDKIFPHLAIGGGWETVMVIVNMSGKPIDFTQRFFDPNGAPMAVTFKSIPEGKITTTSAIAYHSAANGSFNSLMSGDPNVLQTGWSQLQYDETQGRLAAYAMFRQRNRGGTYEALVPLSPYDDTKFFVPVDNLEGFATAIALVNPASNLKANVSLTFYDLNGKVAFQDSITLAPGAQVAFSIPGKYPGLASFVGTLYVQSDITRLSALGLRFNPVGPFSTVPIMNWGGMFQ
jgi:hypothetical protein